MVRISIFLPQIAVFKCNMYSFFIVNKMLFYNIFGRSDFSAFCYRKMSSNNMKAQCGSNQGWLVSGVSLLTATWRNWSYQDSFHHNASYFCVLYSFSLYSIQIRDNLLLLLSNKTSFSVFLRLGRPRSKLSGSDKQAKRSLWGSEGQDLWGEMSWRRHGGCDESLSVWPGPACGVQTLSAWTWKRYCARSLHSQSVWKWGVHHQSTSDWLREPSDGLWALNDQNIMSFLP